MLRFRFLFYIALLLPVLLQAQNTTPAPAKPALRLWSAGANFGMVGWAPSSMNVLEGNNYFTRTFNHGYGQVVDVDGRRHLAIMANTSYGITGGFTWEDNNHMGTTGIMAEIQRNKACYTFNPPFLFMNNGDTFGQWIQTDKYWKFALAVERSFFKSSYSFLGGDQHIYIREAFGMSVGHTNFGNPLNAGHQEDWTESGTGMKSTILRASKQSYMLSSEIGLRNFTEDKDRTFDLGIVFHAPFSKTFTEQYEFFKNGTSVGKSDVTFGGSTITLNARLTFNYTHEAKPKEPKPEPDPEPQPDPVVIVKDTTDRAVDVQSRFSAKGSKTIKIRVWDRDEVDGDEISLYLNGELITSHLPLKRHKKRFKLHLEPGKNYLVMKAENLGTIPPNTAAFELKDGRKKRNITLTSDEGKSGAVEITR